MGWFSRSTDPTKKLDPQLQEFLQTEAPPEHKPPAPPAPEPEPTTQPEPEKPLVPPQSQFPDGRYAHIWKTYRPLEEVEARTKTDNEKLADVVEHYNDRRSTITLVAKENCIFQRIELKNCMEKPKTWSQSMSMCRKENREFDRCIEMQGKFLRALGYLQVYGVDPEAQERIQMHSDELYNRMLKQEEAIEQARAKGEPIPQFDHILSKENIAAAMTGKPLQAQVPGTAETAENPMPTTFDECAKLGMSDVMRDRFEKELLKVHGVERDIERQALIGEFMLQRKVAERYGEAMKTEKEKRDRRIELGKGTMGDKIKQAWGF
ncbi:hypothetical protein K490DRAFT_38853 [Saccharata proteae CBS 121410]|uniref:Autophagy protein n=1 Tax=Saccharata proteae CBS 121410 TaxID=1314787 RepID=A0A6A5YE70_9PEZI|nr:hypothetical protein K490DRAFT_38853 [Saccharata proteae CBS 121410]